MACKSLTEKTGSAVSPSVLSHPRMLVFMGWRNIWRNPVRSLLTVSALAGGLIIVILFSALLEGMSRQMVHYATNLTSGHIQLHRQAYIDDQDLYATLPWDYLTALEQRFPHLTFAPRLQAAGLASSKDSSTGVMLRAVDPKREGKVTVQLDKVAEGRSDLSDNRLLVGKSLAKKLALKPGSELILVTQAADGSIGNAIFIVSGILKPLEPGFDRAGILMSIDNFQQLMVLNEGFHELAVHLTQPEQLPDIQQQLIQAITDLQQQKPLDEWGGAAVVRSWQQLTPMVANMMQMSQSMLTVIGFIVVGLASMGLVNTLLMALHERRHELGILRAIGMKGRHLMLLMLIESFFLALLAALLGAGLGSLAGLWLESHGIVFSSRMPDGYDWGGLVFEPVMTAYLNLTQVAGLSLLMVTVALLSALIPSWQLIKLKPAEVLR